MITRFYIALFTPGGRPNELHIITPGHLALIHSLHHLPSLLGSMLPIFLLKINWTYFGRWAVSPLLITWAWIPQVSWKWGLSVHSHAPAVNKIDTTHQTFAYQIKVTGQTTTSHVQIVTGILLISAKHKSAMHYFLLKQLFKICKSIHAHNRRTVLFTFKDVWQFLLS